MNLIPIPVNQIDWAWADGAIELSEATSDECTSDQLKMLLARGERTLLRLDRDKTVGWCVYKVEQYPNMRVCHVTNLVAHNANFQDFYSEMRKKTEALGCSRIRCCAKPAQSRLYKKLFGFEPIYETLEIKLC